MWIEEGLILIYRVTISILGLLKKDQTGVRRYVYIKQHVLKHTPTVVLSLVSTFMLALLIYTNFESQSRYIEIDKLHKSKLELEARIIQLEEDLFLTSSNFNRAVRELDICNQSPADKSIKHPISKDQSLSLDVILKNLRDSDI